MPEPLLRLRQGLMRHDGGDKTMAQVLNCVSIHGLEAVLVAVELVIESPLCQTSCRSLFSRRINRWSDKHD
jgi:hypothetical protein